MKKILLVWELGSGLGHIMQLLSLAKRLKAEGNELHFLVLEGFEKNPLLLELGVEIEAVPMFSPTLIHNNGIINFSELLLNNGFREQTNLENRVEFWHKKFNEVKTDLIIADHSPSAVLTAYILNIPYVLIGNRFFIPPNISPYPSIKFWQTIPEQQLLAFDEQLLNNINHVCKKYKVKNLDKPQELYANTKLEILQTYNELDPYSEFPADNYHGICVDQNEGDKPVWKNNNKPKVFVYLRPDHPGIKQILLQITKLDADFLLRMKIEDKLLINSLDDSKVSIVEKLLDIDAALEQSDVLICHGSHTIVMQALLKGKPVLCLSRMLEHELTARMLTNNLLGLISTPNSLELQPGRQLTNLLTDKVYSKNAQAFKKKYSKQSVVKNIDDVAKQISLL